MTSIRLITAVWSGFPGGPGTSTFAMTDATHDLTALKDFYGLLAGIIPSAVNVAVENTGPIVSDVTGSLVGTWSENSVVSVQGSNTGDYASGVGAVVRWETGSVVDGHLLRGHTFVVPIYAAAFDTNGSLDTAQRALIQSTADSTLAAYAGELLVWHRPRAASTVHPVARAGSSHVVSSALAVDRPAILRSRRG